MALPGAPGQQAQEDGSRAEPQQVSSRGGSHHLALGPGPVPTAEEQNAAPLQGGREVAAFWSDGPQIGPFPEAEFRATTYSFALFARQPLSQRWDQVIVGKLIDRRRRFHLRVAVSPCLLDSFRNGRRD